MPRVSLANIDHRPYPPPRAPWPMAMRWEHLLFMHWRIDPDALRPHIPATLDIDTYDGSAWLGIVPFTMNGVRARLTPSLPYLSAFHELNVRTYVKARNPAAKSPEDTLPGVWFFSLDAACPPAVATARALFHLNYYNASMTLTRTGSTIDYQSTRTHRGAPPATLDITYQPTGDATIPKPGTLEAFLTDRYRLFASDLDIARRSQPIPRVWKSEIHHEAWKIAPASCEVRTCTMADFCGLSGEPDHLCFARELDVVAWLPSRLPVPTAR